MSLKEPSSSRESLSNITDVSDTCELQPSLSHDYMSYQHRLTFQLVWSTAIACLGTFQFGYHLSELNGTQLILSCTKHIQGPYKDYKDTTFGKLGLPECIPIPENSMSIITTMFTIGGMISLIIIGLKYMGLMGRKLSSFISAGLYMIGSFMMTFATSYVLLNSGRFFAGLGAGLAVVISPILVNEITPVNHRGLLGSCLQLSLALGILSSQLISIYAANDQLWRYIFLLGFIISTTQFVLLFTTVESPKWLIMKQKDTSNATNILSSLRSNQNAVHHEINHWRRLSFGTRDHNETSPLIQITNEDDTSNHPTDLQFWEFLTNTKFRPERIATSIIMSGNQLCGMNAITFYGVLFLQNIVPPSTNILYLTSGFALCNVISALMVSPLFDLVGRKPLLLFSALGMALSSFMISIGLINDLEMITAIACFTFIVAYTFGLSPIVYLMVPEFSNHNAVGICQSFGTTINWISNILIAFWFPILQSWLDGYVFLVFTVINLSILILIIVFIPETKGLNSYQDVWRGFKYL